MAHPTDFTVQRVNSKRMNPYRIPRELVERLAAEKAALKSNDLTQVGTSLLRLLAVGWSLIVGMDLYRFFMVEFIKPLWYFILSLGFLTILFVSVANAALYFNSSEPGCDGSDPNVLWCEDYENGVWFKTYGDRTNPDNKGWAGTAYAPAGACSLPRAPDGGCLPGSTVQDPQFYTRCNGLGAAGTNCAGYATRPNSQGQVDAMSDHNLSEDVAEIYLRRYVRWTTGTVWNGNYKCDVTMNPRELSSGATAGIIFIAQFCNNSGGIQEFAPYAILSPVMDANFFQNLGVNLNVTKGPWFYIETHVLLNTVGQANGVLRMWINNCGNDGVCTGSPTLRLNRTGLTLRNDNRLIGNVWFENYLSGVGPGTAETYYDEIKASKVGPIGFRTGEPPPPPVLPPTLVSSSLKRAYPIFGSIVVVVIISFAITMKEMAHGRSI